MCFLCGTQRGYIWRIEFGGRQSSVVTYACPKWEHAADAHLLKSQRLQNRVLRATGNIDRGTPVRELHVAFKLPCVYDYITKL
jgi:hypothetical protein